MEEKKKIKIIADADAFIALFQPADANHDKAKAILRKLLQADASIYMPVTAMAEAITVFQRKLSNPQIADTLTKKLNTNEVVIIPVDDEIREIAISLFNPYASKQNTFYDAIVAATATVLQADAIFSFDKWYKKQGYTVVAMEQVDG